ncbi:MAG: CBS domain-containing protein [Bacteroidales bacterium]|nr:CBS domain-containing protein [Bacteroidales bacterium]
MTAIELVNDLIIPLGLADKISFGIRQMDENHVAQLPVIDQKKFLGLVFEDDLLTAEDEDLPIESLAPSLKRFSINQHEHFYNALRMMSENHLGLVPVTDSTGFYLGSVMQEDLVEKTAEILSVQNPGGIIILHVSESNFSLAEISRLVESNDVKILSVGVVSLPGSQNLQVTLKLNKINIEPVIQTFYRFEYDIVTYFGENEKDEELLRERYESLMQYLNI